MIDKKERTGKENTWVPLMKDRHWWNFHIWHSEYHAFTIAILEQEAGKLNQWTLLIKFSGIWVAKVEAIFLYNKSTRRGESNVEKIIFKTIKNFLS